MGVTNQKELKMIVKDNALSIEKANNIATKMLQIFSKDSEAFEDGGDPAEQIYLTAHTLALLNAQFSIAMNGYSKIYGIPNFDGKVFKEWVAKIESEILLQNETTEDEICKKFKDEYTQ